MRCRITFSESPVRFAIGLTDTPSFNIQFDESMKRPDCTPYSGLYDITPTLCDQRLETADRHLYEDLTVRKIPYYEVENLSGTTAIIGG